MSGRKTILIAAESVDDADLICMMLGKEFDDVTVSTDPDKATEDFDTFLPAVLVLAFKTLAKAQSYYLGLYRLSAQAHALPHKTLILCHKDELQKVYALCKKGHFSNYILFWPIGYDSTRLPMEVHHALRQLSAIEEDTPSAGEFAIQTRRIAGLEALLEQGLAKGGEQIEFTHHALERAGEDIGLALEGVSRRFAEKGGKALFDTGAPADYESAVGLIQSEFSRLKTDHIDKHLGIAAAAVQPLREWADRFRQDLVPQMDSVRAIQKLSEKIRPTILVVDDDEFQHQLISQLLAEEGVDLTFATSSNNALVSLHHRRPDLILMDIGLPDVDGIESTRRIKALGRFAAIPVVMITGDSQKDVVVQSLKAGAADFVVKPFNKAMLIRRIRTVLEADPKT